MDFIDSHAHLYSSSFEDDLESVVHRAKEVGVTKALLPNIDSSSWSRLLELCGEYPDFFHPMIGLHPTSVKDNFIEELDFMREKLLLHRQDLVAIGEVGLDFYWDTSYKQEQIEAFKTQLDWALEFDLPVVVHTRGKNSEAYETLESILKLYKYADLSGVIHSFTGTIQDVNRFLPLTNWMFGINGIVTFKNSGIDDIIKNIPLERLLIETDCPYLSPVPHRGKRNESSFLFHILVKVAQCYKFSAEIVAKQTKLNTLKLFKALNS